MPFGLLGGSFDPFHLGHAWLVDAALRHGGCSRVWVVPAPHPPHKPDVALTPFAHRVAMARLALAGRSDVLVSEFEANRTGPSYTADTLRELHLLILEADGWVLILGADMAADFASWHQPGEIRRLASLAVATRAGARIPEGLAPEVVLPGQAPDVSATEIRRRVAAGQPIGDLVHPSVAAYIAEHGLYRPDRS